MNNRSLTLLAAALLSPLSIAQIAPNIGLNQGAGDDTMTPIVLSFPFTFPDGTSTPNIFVDSNGRVVHDAAEASDFSESVAEMLAEGSSVCAHWDDLNPGAAGAATDGLFFNDLGSSALITWNNCPLFGGGGVVDCQLVLFPGGTFEVRYGAALLANNDFLIGCSSGGGAIDPGASDISAGAMTAGDPTVYEQFLGTPATDLAGGTITFVPDGAGGYNVASTFPPLAQASFGQPGCAGPSVTFTPDGAGGYNVASGGSFDDTFASGVPLGLGDDDTSDQPLGFAFAMPGGGVPTDIRIDSNGRISDALFMEGSDFTLSVQEFLDESASIAAAADFNPSAGGEVWFTPTAYGCAVTWDGVFEFGTTTPNTFQIQLRTDNSIVFAFSSLEVQATSDFLVGVSAGNMAVDPGESDLSVGTASAGVSEVYEYFDPGVPDVNDFNITGGPLLAANTLPVVGANFDLQIQNVGTNAVASTILISPPIPALDLGLIFPGSGLDGCSFYVNPGTDLVANPLTAGAAISIPLPNDPRLVGLALTAQGIVIDPVASTNSFFIIITNSIDIALGL